MSDPDNAGSSIITNTAFQAGAVHAQGDIHVTNTTNLIQEVPKERRRVAGFHVVEGFFGRKDILKKLHLAIQKGGGNSPEDLKIVSIWGGCGVGKTELVKKYAKKYMDVYYHIILVDTESPEAMHHSLCHPAESLNINLDGRLPRDIIREICDRLCDETMLLIYDNLPPPSDDYSNQLIDLLPPPLPLPKKNPFILTTSRAKRMSSQHEKVLNLPVFTNSESQVMILKELKLEPDQQNVNEASRLADLLGNLPFALQLATFKILQADPGLRNPWSSHESKMRANIESFISSFRKDLGGQKSPLSFYFLFQKYEIFFNPSNMKSLAGILENLKIIHETTRKFRQQYEKLMENEINKWQTVNPNWLKEIHIEQKKIVLANYSSKFPLNSELMKKILIKDMDSVFQFTPGQLIEKQNKIIRAAQQRAIDEFKELVQELSESEIWCTAELQKMLKERLENGIKDCTACIPVDHPTRDLILQHLKKNLEGIEKNFFETLQTRRQEMMDIILKQFNEEYTGFMKKMTDNECLPSSSLEVVHNQFVGNALVVFHRHTKYLDFLSKDESALEKQLESQFHHDFGVQVKKNEGKREESKMQLDKSIEGFMEEFEGEIEKILRQTQNSDFPGKATVLHLLILDNAWKDWMEREICDIHVLKEYHGKLMVELKGALDKRINSYWEFEDYKNSKSVKIVDLCLENFKKILSDYPTTSQNCYVNPMKLDSRIRALIQMVSAECVEKLKKVNSRNYAKELQRFDDQVGAESLKVTKENGRRKKEAEGSAEIVFWACQSSYIAKMGEFQAGMMEQLEMEHDKQLEEVLEALEDPNGGIVKKKLRLKYQGKLRELLEQQFVVIRGSFEIQMAMKENLGKQMKDLAIRDYEARVARLGRQNTKQNEFEGLKKNIFDESWKEYWRGFQKAYPPKEGVEEEREKMMGEFNSFMEPIQVRVDKDREGNGQMEAEPMLWTRLFRKKMKEPENLGRNEVVAPSGENPVPQESAQSPLDTNEDEENREGF